MEVIYATYTTDLSGNAIPAANLMHTTETKCTEESLLSSIKANLFATPENLQQLDLLLS
jgi:hypothetical protein